MGCCVSHKALQSRRLYENLETKEKETLIQKRSNGKSQINGKKHTQKNHHVHPLDAVSDWQLQQEIIDFLETNYILKKLLSHNKCIITAKIKMKILNTNEKYNHFAVNIINYELDNNRIFLTKEQLINHCNDVWFINDVFKEIYRGLKVNQNHTVLQRRIIDNLRHVERQLDISINTAPIIIKQKSIINLFIDINDNTNVEYKYDNDLCLTPKKFRKQRQQFLNADDYKIIKCETDKEMSQLLKDKNNLKDQCMDTLQTCVKMKRHKIWKMCPSLQRIKLMLKAYKTLMLKTDILWKKATIGSIISYKDIYGFQQLVNDFLHVKIMHIDCNVTPPVPQQSDNMIKIKIISKNQQYKYTKMNIIDYFELDKMNIYLSDDQMVQMENHCPNIEYHNTVGYILCTKFENQDEFKCDLAKCKIVPRHYRERTNDNDEQSLYIRPRNDARKSSQIINNKEVVFQQECDKIHSYFLHSTIKYGIDEGEDQEKDERVDQLASNPRHKQSKSTLNSNWNLYKSIEQLNIDEIDQKWWNEMNNVPKPKNNADTDEALYKYLVESYGIFSFQSVHGFRVTDAQNISQLAPRFTNIKEEALKNKYHPLIFGNWNQTLRKSKAFFNSFARNKLRTLYDEEFEDRITGQKETWKSDTQISLQEIVTLKLYTDFGKLQFELKKCMRFQSLSAVLGKNDESITDDNQDKELSHRLFERLSQFFHWRGALLIVLNKFGTRFSDKQLTLYHGVNAKMVLNPSRTSAFWGPLSTSTSYHVARAFASQNGMVLKITTQYPRLNYCKAFNASLISDYPEENEWLIGFIYLRVLQVTARHIDWSIADSNIIHIIDVDQHDKIKESAIPAGFRATFFAVNLFKEQIFSMSEQLERMLAMLLRSALKQCCKMKDFKTSPITAYICQKICDHPTKNRWKKKLDYMNSNKRFCPEKTRRIYKVLLAKLNEFRKLKNKKQSVKIDTISNDLKSFFLLNEPTDVTKTQNGKISFKKIIELYPDIRELYLINQYKLDHDVLNDLLSVINGNTGLNLKKIYFLYYDYTDNASINDHDVENATKALEKVGWDVKKGKTGKVGYVIKLRIRSCSM